MGDVRFQAALERIREAPNVAETLREMEDDEVVAALAACSRTKDPYLANVLATEAMNRVQLKDTMARNMQEAVLAVDPEGRILYANPAAARLAGREEDDLPGTSAEDLLPGILLPLRSGRVVSAEGEIVGGRGPVPVAFTSAPILRERVVAGLVAVIRDVSAQREAERRREARLLATEILTEAGPPERALPRLMEALARSLGWPVVQLWRVEGEAIRFQSGWYEDPIAAGPFREASEQAALRRNRGLPGAAWAEARPVWWSRLAAPGRFLRAESAAKAGLASGFAFPIHHDGTVRAVMEFFARTHAEPDADLMEFTRTLGGQIGAFLDRAARERRLQESERRKAAILDSALDAVVGMDPEGRVVEWNPGAERMYGYSREEALGRVMADLIIPAHLRQRHHQGLARYLRTGQGRVLGRRLQMTGVRRDGTEFPVELAIAVAEGPEGPTFLGFMRDLSAQHALTEKLAASERRYRSLYENLPMMQFAMDAEGRLAAVNRAAGAGLGYEAAELEGRPRLDLVHPEDRARVARRMEDALAGRRLENPAEYRQVHRDGRTLWVSDVTGVAEGPDGRPRVLSLCLDVTEARVAVRREEEERARAERVLAGMTDAYVAFDQEGRFVSVNAAAERLLGRGRKDLLGKRGVEEFPREARAEFAEAIRLGLARGEPVMVEALVATTERWLEIRAFPHAGGVSVFFRDTTERHEREEAAAQFQARLAAEVEQRTRELQRANEELQAFNYLVSHDLKEPVRGVEAFLAALEEDHGEELSEQGRRILGRARKSARNLASLMSGLLELGRVARLGETMVVPVHPSEVAASPVCQAQFADAVAERGAHLAIDPDIPPVLATPSTLCQVLGNLILNGIKHNPSPTPKVRLSGRRDPGTRSVILAVEDNGPGFPQGVLAAHADGPRQPGPVGGPGFGLLIARRVAGRLGGELRLENTEEGARALLRLPEA